MSKVNPASLPGPGDFDPPYDTEEYQICDECGEEFTFDPHQYMDSDGETVTCSPPRLCEECMRREDDGDQDTEA